MAFPNPSAVIPMSLAEQAFWWRVQKFVWSLSLKTVYHTKLLAFAVQHILIYRWRWLKSSMWRISGIVQCQKSVLVAVLKVDSCGVMLLSWSTYIIRNSFSKSWTLKSIPGPLNHSLSWRSVAEMDLDPMSAGFFVDCTGATFNWLKQRFKIVLRCCAGNHTTVPDRTVHCCVACPL